MSAQRPDTETGTEVSEAPGRGRLLRDVGLFQVKLFIDGLRDVMLVPVSLIAALIDLLGRHSSGHFYEVVRIGRRSERWIRLFSAADHLDDHPHETEPETIDQIAARMERKLRDKYPRPKDN
ncbi:MAG: hypothetical protein ACREVN_05345 [Gammaproteobacteria bacterium]